LALNVVELHQLLQLIQVMLVPSRYFYTSID
jgi:hypothetical protein